MIRSLIAAGAAAIAISALPAGAFDMSAMSDAERDAFRAEIRSYLLDNPEVLMEAIGVLEDRQAAAQANADVELIASRADAIFEDGMSWVGGNPDGDVTIVEFIDYRCSFCRRAHPEIEGNRSTTPGISVRVCPIAIGAPAIGARFSEDSLGGRISAAGRVVEGGEPLRRRRWQVWRQDSPRTRSPACRRS
jgi:protein-disulfide isomerase